LFDDAAKQVFTAMDLMGAYRHEIRAALPIIKALPSLSLSLLRHISPVATPVGTTLALSNTVAQHRLSFTGALSSTSASQATNYIVRVKGTAVEVQKATYEGASSAVTLQLAAGTLSAGDAVSVSWNLRDSSGQTVNGQTELTVE
jgi:hypothetical protein